MDLDAEGFVNYAGMDQDDEVLAQIEDFVKKGYLKRFDSLEDCTAFLGAPFKVVQVRCDHEGPLRHLEFNGQEGIGH